jgi:hypothetical protein
MQPFFCSSCGKQNAPDARFCIHCAVAITPPIQPQFSIQPAPILATRQQRKKIQLSTILILAAIIGSVIWLVSLMGGRERDRATAPPSPPAPPRRQTAQKPVRSLNLEKYNAITTGMKQEEVEKILGSKGKQMYDLKDGTGSKSMYAWQEGEAAILSMIQITFINGKVHDKSQFGLE